MAEVILPTKDYEDLVRLFRSSLGTVSASSFTMSKTYYTYPPDPLPFGTVIQPTATNRDFFRDHKQMIVCLQPHNQDAIVAVGLTAGDFYVHLREGFEERWEVVPEDES